MVSDRNSPGTDMTPLVYTCYKTEKPITIDALFDEPAWKKAMVAENWTIMADPERMHEKATFQTKAWLCWDDKNLYVAFECIDPDVTAKRVKKDDDVWEDDAFEIFLDPDKDRKRYVEIEVNPLNTDLDLMITLPRLPEWKDEAKFNVEGLLHAVRTYGTLNYKYDTDEKWVGEIAIPFESLRDSLEDNSVSLPPKDGDTWKFGLFRAEHGSKIKGCEEWNTWSPTTSPHVPEKFATLLFKEK